MTGTRIRNKGVCKVCLTPVRRAGLPVPTWFHDGLPPLRYLGSTHRAEPIDKGVAVIYREQKV